MDLVRELTNRFDLTLFLPHRPPKSKAKGELEDFPHELWLAVFSELVDWDSKAGTQALANLTLVSHRFRALAQPILFQQTGLNYTYRHQSDDAVIQHFQDLVAFITSRPDIARHVLKAGFRHAGSTLSDGIINGFTALLGVLPHLVDLQIDGLPLTDSLLRQIQQSPELRVVRLHNNPDYHFGDGFEDTSGITLRNPALVELEAMFLARLVSRRIKQAVVDLASSPKLRRIRISSHSVSTFFWHSLPTAPTRTYALTAMHLNPPHQEDLPRFFAFLEACPNLIDLRLATISLGIPESMVYNGTLSTRAAPNLRVFGGPMDLARLIVPGRPVTHLKLEVLDSDLALVTAELVLFKVGTRELQILEIDGANWRDGCLVNIARMFPSLVTLNMLNLMGDPLEWLAKHGVEELPCFPRLTHLKIRGRRQFNRLIGDEILAARTLLEALDETSSKIVEAEFYAGSIWKRGQYGWDIHVDPSADAGLLTYFSIQPFEDV